MCSLKNSVRDTANYNATVYLSLTLISTKVGPIALTGKDVCAVAVAIVRMRNAACTAMRFLQMISMVLHKGIGTVAIATTGKIFRFTLMQSSCCCRERPSPMPVGPAKRLKAYVSCSHTFAVPVRVKIVPSWYESAHAWNALSGTCRTLCLEVLVQGLESKRM